MLIKIGRWKVKFGSLLIVGILGFISTCLIFQRSEVSEDSVNYKNRRLKNGPSGSELQTTAASTEAENKDREGVEKNIKISVTLASRDKKQRLTKKK